MQGESVIYQGRLVPKEGFRVFVYSKDNVKKLASSWEEYLSLVTTGIWYPTTEDAICAASIPPPEFVGKEEIKFSKVPSKKKRNF